MFWSFSSFRLVSRLRLGIVPPSSLPQRFSSTRLVKPFSHVGIPPPAPTLWSAPESHRCVRFLRPLRSGKLPLRLLLCSSSF